MCAVHVGHCALVDFAGFNNVKFAIHKFRIASFIKPFDLQNVLVSVQLI